MTKLLKFFAFFAAGLIVFAVALVFILLVVIDPNRYRATLESVVQQQTGYQLRIIGDMRWTFRPVFGLSLQDVRLSNTDSPQELASFSTIALRLQPAGLLSGRLQMEEFVAENLHVNWMIDSSGRSNWQTTSAPAQSAGGNTDIPIDINFQQITVRNASFDYRDAAQGINTSLQNIDLSSRNANLNGRSFPLEMAMRLVDNASGRRLNMNLTADAALDLNAGNLALDNLRFNLSPLVLNGRVAVNDFQNNLSWQADLNSNTFNLAFLLENFADIDEALLTPPNGRQVALQQLSASGDTSGITVDTLQMQLNDSPATLSGDVLFATSSRPLMVTYTLNSGALDLNEWLPAAAESADAAESSADSDESAPGSTTTPEPALPFELLDGITLRGSHSIESLHYNNFTFAPLAFELRVENRRLALLTEPAGFYDGTLQAQLQVDANATPPGISVSSTLENISATALTADHPRLDFFTGRFNLDTQHSLSGSTPSALLDSISGASRIQISDSSVDISLLKRVFAAISVINPRGDIAAQWPDVVRFNTVDGLLVFNDGLDTNQELNLRLDNFDVTGNGGIDLYAGRFDYRVNFTILGEPAPQSIRVNPDYQNVAWPIRCESAFSDPGIQYCSPDLQRVREVLTQTVRDEVQNRASEVINEQVDRLRDRVRNLLQN